MISKASSVWWLLFVAALFLGAAPAETQVVPRFEVAEGDDFPVAVPSTRRATLGYLVVWEDRRTRRATVRLPVAVVHAAESSESAPVLFLTGGPGSGSLSPAAYPGAYPWTTERDFVVFGQRGTRHAQPSLDCPEIEEAFGAAYSTQSAERRDSILAGGAAACRRRLVGEGVDLSAYHTDATTADIDDLAQVLGARQFVLFAISYGTRIALDLARDYPGRVSAMVLDSPLPPDVRYDDESALNFRRSLAGVARDCASQPACAGAYSELETRFFSAIDDAEREPVRIPAEGGARAIDLDGARLAALVDLGSPGGIRDAPRRMAIIADRDLNGIRSLVPSTYGGSDFSWGMRVSVWCAEAWPFSERSRMDQPSGVLGGYESAAIPPAFCREWRVPARPDEFVTPVRSDIPTLLIAGEFDPATPPSWATRAARLLTRSRVIIVPGGGHTPSLEWSGDGCAMRVAAAFVSDPGNVLEGGSIIDCIAGTSRPVYRVQPDEAR